MITEVKPKERPILFSGEMVRAVLDGRKTQTRRVCKKTSGGHLKEIGGNRRWHPEDPNAVDACPYGQPGDKEWRREPIPASGWYHVRGLLDESIGGDGRAVWVDVVAKDAYLWGFSREDDPESMGLDGDIDERTVEWKRPGDHLWVRETWATHECHDVSSAINRCGKSSDLRVYRADGWSNGAAHMRGRWRPSIHMPRWASRITLKVTDVRVERVQDISEEDAIAEGITIPPAHIGVDMSGMPIEHPDGHMGPVDIFAELWDSINAKRNGGIYSWESNPWVWVVEFERVGQ